MYTLQRALRPLLLFWAILYGARSKCVCVLVFLSFFDEIISDGGSYERLQRSVQISAFSVKLFLMEEVTNAFNDPFRFQHLDI